jgi:phosphonate transport system ATP-binding protein
VELARAFADRVVGLHRGEIVFDGAPRDLDDAALTLIYHQTRPGSSPSERVPVSVGA